MPDGSSSTGGLLYANIVYKDLISRINEEVDQDYFSEIYLTDTVASQNEYTLPVAGAQSGMDSIIGGAIKYNTTDTIFTKMRPQSVYSLTSS